MKYRSVAAGAALVSAAYAKDTQTFAVMRFNGDEIFNGNLDPIVNPGESSPHEHTVFGGSNFGPDATGESLAKSSCTSAKVKGDNSAYWMPRVYYHDEAEETFEPVPVLYTNVYYFFDPTDDEIKAFPKGLNMLTGDVSKRDPPSAGGKQNLDPSAGDINNLFFTCARDSHDPPSWPADSDGTTCGIASDSTDHQGVGFPLQKCSAMASPLRADAHFPSCYNPDAGLTAYKENMEFPSSAGNGKLNCPEGYVHVPRLLFEIYWDTQQFDDRWTPDGKTQPFVLSNGDVTGYSLHADVLASWDEDVLQSIIDGCNVQHATMDTCPGVEKNTESCACEGDATSFLTAVTDGPLKELPGGQQLSGFQYGDASPAPASSGGDSYAEETEEPETEVPEVEVPAQYGEDGSEEPAEEPVDDASPVTEPEPVDEGVDEAPVTQAPLPTAEPVCSVKTKTVVETITVWEEEAAQETEGTYAKRHMQRHARHHHRF